MPAEQLFRWNLTCNEHARECQYKEEVHGSQVLAKFTVGAQALPVDGAVCPLAYARKQMSPQQPHKSFL